LKERRNLEQDEKKGIRVFIEPWKTGKKSGKACFACFGGKNWKMRLIREGKRILHVLLLGDET
jgi:hypothetical protein